MRTKRSGSGRLVLDESPFRGHAFFEALEPKKRPRSVQAEGFVALRLILVYQGAGNWIRTEDLLIANQSRSFSPIEQRISNSRRSFCVRFHRLAQRC